MKCKNCLKSLTTRLVVGTLACVCLAGLANAAIVVSDTWQDGIDDDPAAPVYSENGVDSDLDGDIESAWYQGGDGTLNPVGPGGPLRGQFSSPTGGSSASWTSYFTAEGNEIELVNVGDSLKVTWAFSASNINTSNSSQNLRMAVVDSTAATRLLSNGSPGDDFYTGYGMFMNFGQTFGRSTPFRIVERADTFGAILSSSGEWATVADAPGDLNGNPGYTNGVPYTFEMTITRAAGGLLDINSSMTGGNINGTGSVSSSASGLSPNNGSFKFDTFSLRPSGATTTAEIFDTSLFQVEFTPIPEPASLALLGLSALAMVCRRQR